MKIDHLAMWVTDLEKMKSFYQQYFQVTSGEKYFNPKKNFESYFLNFENGCRLEIMKMPSIPTSENDIYRQFTGLIHFAISTGSKQAVDVLTEQLRADGYEVVGEPRTTGDGYYESVILDPEGNRIEITE
ncbi:VOC family protein [Ohtaekwangia sp.]|uniref:VOC family protein n=1 Tax=Ohtaekwangia sp. TaxID=2066019 RepID=UPI002FDE5F70